MKKPWNIKGIQKKFMNFQMKIHEFFTFASACPQIVNIFPVERLFKRWKSYYSLPLRN